jgi:hypothetical protein
VFAVIIFLPLSPTSGYLGVFLVISSGDVARTCEAYFLPAFSLSIYVPTSDLLSEFFN